MKDENYFVRMVRMVRFYYPGTWERDNEVAEWFEKKPSSVTRWRKGDNDNWLNDLDRIRKEFPVAYEAYDKPDGETLLSVSEIEKESQELKKRVEELEGENATLKSDKQELTKTVVTGMELLSQARTEYERIKAELQECIDKIKNQR